MHSNPPCVLFEDEHLLAVNKPAGMNTHAPAPRAGEGIYDWLRHREPRWKNLAILHRLDKETSGVIVFGKTALANRSLTEQFTNRAVRKKYFFATDRSPKKREWTVKSKLFRTADHYVSGASGEPAETRFAFHESRFPLTPSLSPTRSGGEGVRRTGEGTIQDFNAQIASENSLSILAFQINQNSKIKNLKLIEASPLTGRTHQIRVHAAESGVPILGDVLYGGSPFARVCLHAAEIIFHHPATGAEITFSAPVDFSADARLALRAALIDPRETDAFRIIHGASDGWPGWHVDRLGDFFLSQSEHPLNEDQIVALQKLPADFPGTKGAYHKILNRQVRRTTPLETSPQLILGEPAPERFHILENGVRFELSFNEGYSVGLFLDQRDNRRRLLTGHIAAEFDLPRGDSRLEILNAFAYTCGFSVCAARFGARVTSLDLSKKYLEWGRRNFALNELDPAEHDFIYGDAFDWFKRLAKKNRGFDLVVLDPPTFSQSKERGAFRVEKDFGKLISAALPLLKPNGILFASTNAATWPAEEFLNVVENTIQSTRRKILQTHYVPQPPDFPITRAAPAYLKTVWLRVG
ncbi:MAG TPA: pseudouridine synthase [Verrucomicrobiae bacterium]|nr:pseudouridine synthase [Verrucomicrobiae bacterium]